jgi:MoaA/NifB/PqqE/SkfB family radical SAM enzyme
MATQETHVGRHAGHSVRRAVRTAPKSKKSRKKFSRRLIGLAGWLGPSLARMGPVRRILVGYWEKKLLGTAEEMIERGANPPGVIRDRAAMGMAMIKSIERVMCNGNIGRVGLNRILNTLIGDSFVNAGIPSAKERFKAEFGVRPPGFFLISPTKACNLRCTGCYADSGGTSEKLEWPILTRMIRECRDLWGVVFYVISGGEPLVYRDEGKSVLDLAEMNPDCFFMMYTNGTLIDDKIARRMGELGNIMPAISVEGLREPTDKRRGAGVFDQIVAAMERLRREKVIFGISMTATRDNADVLLSDETVDFYFTKMGAMFGWLFHYMPMGRAFTLEMLPTPEQRLRLWQRSQELIYDKQVFLADFWNSGPAAHGCISAGYEGGYLTVDWNGKITPCVFMPYSPMNIHDVYAQGKNLNDVWRHPFLAKVRAWQWEYSNEKKYTKGSWHGNWMTPCPIRDHYDQFHKMLEEHHPDPVDENARAAMEDPDYLKGMVAYNKEVTRLLDPIWERRYMKDVR